MKQIFEAARIGKLELKNRLVRSATWENLADEQGHITYPLYQLYKKLAAGGIGLIITGYAFVSKDEQPNPGMLGIYDDSFITEYRKLTDMVHEQGSKIVMQIVYGGSQTGYPPEGRLIWGPSAVADLATGVTPTPISADEIETLVKDFGDAAVRAKEAGFDGVQLHGAHNYLLSQFLSPYYNRRTDEYGGSVENRTRLHREVYQEARRRVGNDFPLMIKLNCEDFIENGATIEDSLFLSKMLAELGIDALEVSGGTGGSGDKTPARMKIHTPEKEAYHAEYANRIAAAVDVPVILVGGLRSPEVIDKLLQDTEIELFSLARPLLTEPDLPQRWQNGDRSRARCVSCNHCLQYPEGGNYCILNAKKEEEHA
jgi:2,4-dienoyl-CoA reductase-like NADH-dependent reductase (Old Yellow Enzyme family)